MTIAESLKRFRKEFGVTQQQVADSIQIVKPAYQKYEYGKNIPLATVLVKLADAYNVSVDYLLGRTDNPQIAAPLK
ncbi:MAG: helix-turn-helix transcriptional regulator [Selenomonadaceae bacterium]|nr:helix-turn-helix transcriptional regulator [Selenomonadaceae bacterium]